MLRERAHTLLFYACQAIRCDQCSLAGLPPARSRQEEELMGKFDRWYPGFENNPGKIALAWGIR